MADNPLQRFLDKWAKKVGVNAIKVIDETVNYGGGQSAGLSESVDPKAEVFNDGRARVTISLYDYYKFIDKGVDGYEKSHGSPFKFKKGTKPIPYSKLANTVGLRKLVDIIPVKGNSFAQKEKTLKFMLSHSIKKNGIKPKPFVKKILTPELMNELKDGLAQTFKEQFIIDLKAE